MTVLKDKQKLGVRASESYPFHHISGIKRILDLMLGYQSRLDLFPTHRGWRLMIIFGKSCVHLFVSCIFCGRSRSFISFFFGSVAEALFLLLCPPWQHPVCMYFRHTCFVCVCLIHLSTLVGYILTTCKHATTGEVGLVHTVQSFLHTLLLFRIHIKNGLE